MQHLVQFLGVKFQVFVLLLLLRLSMLEADLIDEHHLLEVVLVVEVRHVLLCQLLLNVLYLAPEDLVHVADGEGGKGNLRDGDGVGVDGDHERAGQIPGHRRAYEADPGPPGADNKNHPKGIFKPVGRMMVTPELEAVDGGALKVFLSNPCHIHGSHGAILLLLLLAGVKIAVCVVIARELSEMVKT